MRPLSPSISVELSDTIPYRNASMTASLPRITSAISTCVPAASMDTVAPLASILSSRHRIAFASLLIKNLLNDQKVALRNIRVHYVVPFLPLALGLAPVASSRLSLSVSSPDPSGRPSRAPAGICPNLRNPLLTSGARRGPATGKGFVASQKAEVYCTQMRELAQVDIVLHTALVSQKVGDGIMASARDSVVWGIGEHLAVHNH